MESILRLYIILQHCECYSVRFEYVIYYTSAVVIWTLMVCKCDKTVYVLFCLTSTLEVGALPSIKKQYNGNINKQWRYFCSHHSYIRCYPSVLVHFQNQSSISTS